MHDLLPWPDLLQPIEQKYPKPGRGRRPIPAAVMGRIYFMQQWYGLSDPAMEDSLYEVASMRRFAGVTLDRIPDDTTICKFRHFLEKHRLTEALFQRTAQYLSGDPQMGSTKQGTTWYFGLKAHVGSDLQGRVHHVVVTPASVHDSTMMDECLHGQEQVIYGDKAYARAQRQAAAESEGVDWRVLRKARRRKKLTGADRAFNPKSNRVCARVEHAFGVIKHLWGYRKVRYRGLAKNAAQILTLFALANFYLARSALAAR